MKSDSHAARDAVQAVSREHHGRLLAALNARFLDLALCEDALQDAVVAALANWPEKGVPDNPPAWLMRTAARKAIDRLRYAGHRLTDSSGTADAGPDDLPAQGPLPEDIMDTIPDERLRLIFTCCHPAIAERSRVELTLKVVCGLTTAEVARAFVIGEKGMAQRLVRAKRKIKLAGIPYEVPPVSRMTARLNAVLAVIYFIFNEGYVSSEGSRLIRIDLCDEAIRLCAILLHLLPGEVEAMGLMALMQFHHARRDARVDGEGCLVDLEHQDRSLWDRERTVKADELLMKALMHGKPGSYQVQAAISALHNHAPSFDQTDWPQMVGLYRELQRIEVNPVVVLNTAVAISYAESPQVGLDYMEGALVSESLSGYHPYHAAMASFHHRLGNDQKALKSYDRAVSLCRNDRERAYLETKAVELAQSASKSASKG